MLSIASSTLNKVISRVRPRSDAAASVAAPVLLGWYLRKGLAPVIRGSVTFWLYRRARLPLFVGRGTSISYRRQIYFGKSCFVGARSTINAFSVKGIHFGDRVTLRENAWIQCSSHPSAPGIGLRIGDGTYIGPSVVLGVGGPITIGANCQIGAHVTIIAENHAIEPDGTPSSTRVVRVGVQIGDDCWLGHGVSLLDGVVLGKGCIVGAGAVVTKSFPGGSKIAGVPARLLNG